MFQAGTPSLTSSSHLSARLTGRVDFTEDPADVYRVFIPAHKSATISVRGSENVDLELWKPATRTVDETGAAMTRDLAGKSAKRGTAADTVTVPNRGRSGAYYYADVFPGPKTGAAAYKLSITIHA